MHGLTYDTKNTKSIYADKRIRQAIEYAIDKQSIARALGYGQWKPMYQYCPEGRAGYSSKLEPRSYNTQKAKQLLAEAGYPTGLRAKAILDNRYIGKDAAEAIQSNLKDAGIQLDIEFVDPGLLNNYRSKGWNDAMMGFLTAAEQHMALALQRTIDTGYIQYFSMLRPPEMADLYQKAFGAPDFDAQKTYTEQIVKLIYDEAMITPLWVTPTMSIKNKNIKDDQMCNFSHYIWYPGNAWISK